MSWQCYVCGTWNWRNTCKKCGQPKKDNGRLVTGRAG